YLVLLQPARWTPAAGGKPMRGPHRFFGHNSKHLILTYISDTLRQHQIIAAFDPPSGRPTSVPPAAASASPPSPLLRPPPVHARLHSEVVACCDQPRLPASGALLVSVFPWPVLRAPHAGGIPRHASGCSCPSSPEPQATGCTSTVTDLAQPGTSSCTSRYRATNASPAHTAPLQSGWSTCMPAADIRFSPVTVPNQRSPRESDTHLPGALTVLAGPAAVA
ncbi:hypothetical protein Vretimale_15198, partial [Volvox reticuliferus]